MTQCPYFYHTNTNPFPKRCGLEEGHEGQHVEENPHVTQFQQGTNFRLGWIKH